MESALLGEQDRFSQLHVRFQVLVRYFPPGLPSTEARKVLDEYRKGVISFLAPDLINAEVGNVIWKKHVLQGLAAADAEKALDEFRDLEFTFVPMADLLDEAYQVAVEHKQTVYDALYLVLSVGERCQFVTADERHGEFRRHIIPGSDLVRELAVSDAASNNRRP